MRLLTFRVELLAGLEVRWHEGRTPCLAVTLAEDERASLRAAGGSERWDRLEAHLPQVRKYLIDGVPLPQGSRIDIVRIDGDRVRLTFFFGRTPIAERACPERIFREALRIAERAASFERALAAPDGPANEASPAPEPEVDPERAAWEAVWAEEKPTASPEPPPIPPPPAVEPPATTAPVPPAKVSAPSPRQTVPQGPLRIAQVRLFAQALSRDGSLPASLSEAARQQVLAFAAS